MEALYRGSGLQQHSQMTADGIVRGGESKRFWELDKLERYYKGTQYVGMPSWWDKSVPLQQRAPCIIYPLPRAACEQATRFTFGEGKFPDVRFVGRDPTQDPDAADDVIEGLQLALNLDEAKTLDELYRGILTQSGLKLVMRELLRRGLAMRTAVCVVTLRDGELCFEPLNAKYCTAQWADSHAKRLASICCRYKYPVEEPDDRGKLVTNWYWYRRDITTEADVCYLPAPVAKDGSEPEWRINEARTVVHQLGFVPAKWMPNLPQMDIGDEDGFALIDGLEKEIDGLNFALSVRHRGALYYGTPQYTETGVAEGDGPAAQIVPTRRIETLPTQGGGQMSFDAGPIAVRASGPDVVWSYQADSAKIGIMEQTGSASRAVTEHVADLRARILEAISVVLVDPAIVSGKAETSAKALQLLHQPLLALVDDLRECWGSHFRDLLGLALRLVLRTIETGGVVYLPHARRAAKVLSRFDRIVAVDEQSPGRPVVRRWFQPQMSLLWGDHFPATNTDVKEAVAAVAQARAFASKPEERDPIISQKTAVRYVATYFGVNDLDAEMKAIVDEKTAAHDVAQRRATDEQTSLHAAAAALNKPNGDELPHGDEPDDGESDA